MTFTGNVLLKANSCTCLVNTYNLQAAGWCFLKTYYSQGEHIRVLAVLASIFTALLSISNVKLFSDEEQLQTKGTEIYLQFRAMIKVTDKRINCF